jgi:autotransporter adhesin
MIMLSSRRVSAGLAALVLALALCLGAAPAKAQFVCSGSEDGDDAPSGQGATAGGTGGAPANNFACGENANATGANSNNAATGNDAKAFGEASGNTATGVGADAHSSLNIQGHTNSPRSFNTATGNHADAHGDNSGNVATGASALAYGDNSGNTATGAGADAHGNSSFNIATGNGATASGDRSGNIAFGNGAVATGNDMSNIAIGSAAVATGANAVAIGNGATATFANSAAFGNGAVAARANQQVFGTAANTYTMAGIESAASKAAQTGPTQIVTSDSGGNLATTSLASLGVASSTDIAGINSQLGGINSQLVGINSQLVGINSQLVGINTRIDDLQRESRRGIAATAALATAMMPSAPGKTTISANSGFFHSDVGLGVAIAHRLNFPIPVIVQGAYANSGGTQHVGRVGVAVEF